MIINEQGITYAESLSGTLESLVRTSQSSLGHEAHPGHGGVYILRGDQLADADRVLLLSAEDGKITRVAWYQLPLRHSPVASS